MQLRHFYPLASRVLRTVALLLVLSATPPASSEDLIGLYLSWQNDPTTTMTLNWVDPYADSSDTVWYRPYESKEWATASAEQSNVGPMTLQLRRVELKKLKPGTLYEFGIGEKTDDVSHFWRFRTMPATLERPITFVEGGDMMHTRKMLDAMSRNMQKLDPDFAMLIGDLAYEDGVNGTHWIDWLQSWRKFSVAKGKRLIPMVVGIGNHEVKGHYNGKIPEDAPYYYSLFSQPGLRSYYALDFGDYLSLVILDSAHTQPVAGPQAEWLKTALAERDDQQFLFAGYHFPAYGTDKAPKDGTPLDAPLSVEMRKHWIPHFERHGASIIFEHDHHNFKRTHRIRNEKRDDANGLLYLGDGAWGVKTRTVPPDAWWLAKAEARNHLWHGELRKDGTATFKAIDVEGEVFDEVELTTSRTKPVP